MTKLQKRVYSLILRSLILLLYFKFHQPDRASQDAHHALRKDLHEAIMDLEGIAVPKEEEVNDET